MAEANSQPEVVDEERARKKQKPDTEKPDTDTAALTKAELTHEQAKVAITDILKRISDVQDRIDQARAMNVGTIMEVVIPLFFEIQGTVMQQYGFEPSNEGFAAFAAALAACEDNAEVKKLSDELKTVMTEATALCLKEEEGDEEEGDEGEAVGEAGQEEEQEEEQAE